MKQFRHETIVNGKGMDFADLVTRTCLNTDRGLANMAMQNNTATFPSRLAVFANGFVIATNNVPKITARIDCMCCLTLPGKVGVETFKTEVPLVFGRYFTN